MSGSIVVGVDESTPSRSALAWSVERAAVTGASLELVHVIDSPHTPRPSAAWDVLHDRAAALLRAELSFARELAADIAITTRIANGGAEDALVRRSSGRTLMVVGTHKTGFIYGRTFGSRFLGLAWRARCDVAYIPDLAGASRRGVVAALDNSATGEGVMRFAALEAASGAHELTLVRVDDPEHAHANDQAQSVAELQIAHPAVHVVLRSSELPTAEALIDAAANAELLVIGRPRRAGAGYRSINHDVLLNLRCPVIVVCAG